MGRALAVKIHSRDGTHLIHRAAKMLFRRKIVRPCGGPVYVGMIWVDIDDTETDSQPPHSAISIAVKSSRKSTQMRAIRKIARSAITAQCPA
jgi:hypothetical protein